jgi:D-alanine-D-alanine ligase
VLIEQFIHGQNCTSRLSDCPDAGRSPTVLPLTEVRFEDDDPSVWPIYPFDAKWAESSREYEATPLVCPVALSPPFTPGSIGLPLRRIGCWAAAITRVDVRMTPEGEFDILEVNPNPFINSLALGMAWQHWDGPAEPVADLMRRLWPRGPTRGGRRSISVA